MRFGDETICMINQANNHRTQKQRAGWYLVEAIVSMSLLSIVLTVSLTMLTKLQARQRAYQHEQLALYEAENIAQWISIQPIDRVANDTTKIELPNLFPTPAAKEELLDVSIAVNRFDEEAAIDFDRFEITIHYTNGVAQPQAVRLTTWRTWP
jgi:type II secretory pathway pseudopilin PulG